MRSSWTSAARVRIPTPAGTGAAYVVQREARVDAITAFLECLAEHGVDPHLEQGRIVLGGQEFFDERFPARAVKRRVQRRDVEAADPPLRILVDPLAGGDHRSLVSLLDHAAAFL